MASRRIVLPDAKDGVIFIIVLSASGRRSVAILEHEVITADQIISAVAGLAPWFTLAENCVLKVIYDQNLLSTNNRVCESVASSI